MGTIGTHCFIVDKMDINETTIQLMKDLFSSEKGLLPYTLYKRYGVTPKALVDAVKSLQDKGYLAVGTDNRLMLTRLGKENVEGIISSRGRKGSDKIDSDFFISIAGSLLDKRKPYIPSIRFFELYTKEGVENG